jgi:hypothetical protein
MNQNSKAVAQLSFKNSKAVVFFQLIKNSKAVGFLVCKDNQTAAGNRKE